MIAVPPGLDAARDRGPEWAAWLDALPRLAADVCADWELTPDGDPWHGHTALVLPVHDASGTRLALKLTFMEEDNAGEIPALKAWRGLGAVRLERADPRRGALLLERLGRRSLASVDPLESCATIGRLYRRLHVPAPPTVPPLAPLLTRWLDDLAALGRDVPAPPRFVQQALVAGRRLASEGGRATLHGDLHDANVLAGRREPWLVIDPKGFAGDPGYDVAPLLWNRWDEAAASGDVGGEVRERFWATIDAAELDERRTRDWVVVRAMVNVSWEVQDARAQGRPLSTEQRDWITRMVTVAKAMQAVASGE